jgi:SulP family sulfate permease
VRIIAQWTAAIAPWRRGYDRAWLSRDIVSGLAAGAVVIPQAMAYATVADLPVMARLLRLGVLIDNISEATLTGIKVGVGLTVAAGQLPKVRGIPGNPNADNFFSELRHS